MYLTIKFDYKFTKVREIYSKFQIRIIYLASIQNKLMNSPLFFDNKKDNVCMI